MKTKYLTDTGRLRELLRAIIEPYNHSELSHLTNEMKLIKSFQTDEHPIYRRMVKEKMRVTGLWWVEENKYLRFSTKNFHNKMKIIDMDGVDTLLLTRQFQADKNCYIREYPDRDRVDIEGLSYVNKWDFKKKKRVGATDMWLTVSVTKEEYKRLDSFLGARQNCCDHKGLGLFL